MAKNKIVCGNCCLWETEDGTPYCVAKDLYTHTRRNHPCDERDIDGCLCFAEKRDN